MDNIAKEYFIYIKENTKFIQNHESQRTEIATPFVNSYGEGILFNIDFDGDKFYTLTDDGFTLWNLELEGVKVKKGLRKKQLQSLLDYSGFELNKRNEIEKKVTKTHLGQAIHDMTQLLLNVYDFSMLSPQNVHSQFLEDVNYYFMGSDKYNVFPNFSISGKSRLNHRFNYLFTSKGKSKIVRIHNSIDKQQVDNILASWLDTVEYRRIQYGQNEELYIVISDEGYKNVNENYLIALQEYDINVLNFADKAKLEEQLSA